MRIISPIVRPALSNSPGPSVRSSHPPRRPLFTAGRDGSASPWLWPELTDGGSGSKVNRMVKYQALDRTFSALSDGTRRDILEHLQLGPASISELAEQARISLPGVLKHVRILEEARLVTTEKKGRTRECRLGPDQMDDVTRWIESHREVWERRLDRLEAVVQKRKGERR